MADVTEEKLPKTILPSFVEDFVVSSRVNGISNYIRKRMTERGKFSPPLVSFPFPIHRLKLVAALFRHFPGSMSDYGFSSNFRDSSNELLPYSRRSLFFINFYLEISLLDRLDARYQPNPHDFRSPLCWIVRSRQFNSIKAAY